MEEIRFKRKPKLNRPYLIVAWPGMGEVAVKSATYLVEKFKAEEFAYLPAEDFFYFTEATVKEGVLSLPQFPSGKFYYWKNKNKEHDLIIFISSSQPDLAKAEGYSLKIIELAKAFGVERVIGFAAMPLPIEHTQNPNVWFSATSLELNGLLKKNNLQVLTEGQISGLNGLFIGLAKKAGLDGFCLLGEIPLYTIQTENPKASHAILETLSRILNFDLNLSDLMEEANAMDSQINSLLDYLKAGPSLGPIGEEEIEKIKKSLSQLTRLPVSVKEKIEKLFLQARQDISKANDLKIELDKWSVYKEYEDRFLDLFKKTKDKNN